jgi:NAD(P)-dependent dehydrogenase (short-subunit alcohol dehydrogenase family)
MYNLGGKVALVTGGATGIGRAIALRLADEGCDVAIFDRDEKAGAACMREIESKGRRAVAFAGDVSKESDVVHASQGAAAKLGDVDILVNNAGISQIQPTLDMSSEDFERMFRINMFGMFYFCKAVMPAMVKRRSGCVINMSSWVGKSGRAFNAAYAGSKFAVIGYTQAVAAEMGPHNVRVNAICPGLVVDTRMRVDSERSMAALGLPPAEERARAIPLGRVSRPDDVARCAAFLASDEASYITGEAINVTGGLWMG